MGKSGTSNPSESLTRGGTDDLQARVTDVQLQDLRDILFELRIINKHLEVLTEAHFEEHHVDK